MSNVLYLSILFHVSICNVFQYRDVLKIFFSILILTSITQIADSVAKRFHKHLPNRNSIPKMELKF